ncbi:MAG: hypothetical protein ACQESH_07005 [Campylobacterota bacterium]
MAVKEISKFMKNKYYLEVIIATSLFALAVYTDSIIQFIILMLYFIIFLEIVRTVIGFVREQRVRITPLINAFIILALREFIVTVVKVNKESADSFEMMFNSATNFHLLVFSGVLLFLFLLRYIAYKTSPDRFKDKELI